MNNWKNFRSCALINFFLVITARRIEKEPCGECIRNIHVECGAHHITSSGLIKIVALSLTRAGGRTLYARIRSNNQRDRNWSTSAISHREAVGVITIPDGSSEHLIHIHTQRDTCIHQVQRNQNISLKGISVNKLSFYWTSFARCTTYMYTQAYSTHIMEFISLFIGLLSFVR